MALNRRTFLAAAASSTAFLSPRHGLAHHGWSSFDSRFAYYSRGAITHVRWGNPHTEVSLSVEQTALPAGFRDRTLPPGADEDLGQATLASARPYEGEHAEIHLVLSGPTWMSRWGLDRPLETGETLEVLGFLANADAQELRPMMFWLENGQGVWQQLTSLPTPPEPASGN